jgi:hypothetical protein
MKLTDCYYEKKDWRVCKKEVSQTRLFSCVRCVAALATEMLPNYKTIERCTIISCSANIQTVDGDLQGVLEEARK